MKSLFEAVRSIMRAADAVGIVLALAAVFGVNFLIPELPTWLSALIVVASYIFGFVVGCDRTRREADVQAKVEAAKERSRIETEAEIEEKREREKRTQVERQERESCELAERKRIDEVNRIFRKKIMEMDFELKSVLFFVYSKTCVEMRWIDPYTSDFLHEETFEEIFDRALDEIKSYGFVKYETTAPDARMWILSDGVSDLIEGNIGLFEKVPTEFCDIRKMFEQGN